MKASKHSLELKTLKDIISTKTLSLNQIQDYNIKHKNKLAYMLVCVSIYTCIHI